MAITVIVLVAVLSLFLLIIIIVINDQFNVRSQESRYRAAVAHCGDKPTVVIISHALEDTSSTLYTPTNPMYDRMKAVVERPLDILGGDQVQDYYCSAIEARAANIRSSYLIDPKENYVSIDQQKEIYLLAVKSVGAAFYQPTVDIPGFSLRKKTFESDNQMKFGYFSNSKSKPDTSNSLDDLDLACASGQSDQTSFFDFSRSDRKTVGVNMLGKPIYFASHDNGSYSYNSTWSSELKGVECILIDRDAVLSADQGLSLISSLREVDLSAIKSFDFPSIR